MTCLFLYIVFPPCHKLVDNKLLTPTCHNITSYLRNVVFKKQNVCYKHAFFRVPIPLKPLYRCIFDVNIYLTGYNNSYVST